MGEDKGPYRPERIDGVWYVSGPNGDMPFDDQDAAEFHSETLSFAWSSGRASRDGLRKALEQALKFIIDQATECGACAHSQGHCICDITRLAEDVEEALEADWEEN